MIGDKLTNSTIYLFFMLPNVELPHAHCANKSFWPNRMTTQSEGGKEQRVEEKGPKSIPTF